MEKAKFTKDEKFCLEKIVEWNNLRIKGNPKQPWTYKDTMLIGLIVMIPIIGNLVGLLFFLSSWKHRTVYWKVHKPYRK